MAFLEFSQILWETSKPTLILTDNKSVTRFLEKKVFPPSLWNVRGYVLHFHFKIAQIAGSVHTAIDFLYRLDYKVREKIRPRIRADVQTTPFEVTAASSDVADEEQFFFTQTDSENEIEEQTVERRQQFRKKATEWVANEPRIKKLQRLRETLRHNP